MKLSAIGTTLAVSAALGAAGCASQPQETSDLSPRSEQAVAEVAEVAMANDRDVHDPEVEQAIEDAGETIAEERDD